jgi:LysM repeat protein
MLPSYDFEEKASLKKRHVVFILLANALISAAISLAVFQVMDRLEQRAESGAGILAAVAPPLSGAPSPTTADEPGGARGPIIHQVRPGDTLFGLAILYNVSVEAIMKVNELGDPDHLQIGQQLLIPQSISSPTEAGAQPTTIPFLTEPVGTPPTPQTATTGGKLVEIVAIVLSSGDGAKGEVVILSNSGSPVDLKGWTLSDKDGNAYTFPEIVIPTGGSLAVHTLAGKDTATDLFWEREEAIWQKGVDQATLRDDVGRIIYTYDVK